MRISDWSSDVCSSDLNEPTGEVPRHRHRIVGGGLVEQHRHVGLSAFTIETEGFDVGRCRGAHISHGRATLHRYNFPGCTGKRHRSEEHTSELQSLMRISYAVFCLKKKTTYTR